MKLEFLNPVHNTGKNVTVRRGIKWSLETKAAIDGLGSEVPIKCKVIRFLDISHFDLSNEHDPSCHTLGGLLDAMRKAYSDFEVYEIVTVVEYEVGERFNDK